MAAAHHARRALADYQQHSHPDFYLQAGVALELAIKARLVGDFGVHMIAPDGKGWFETAQLIARDIDGKSGKRPRTVDAVDALRRLQKLEPGLPDVFGANVEATLDRRNVGVHAGHAAPPSPDEFLGHAAAFVRAVGALLRVPPEQFWGNLAGLADELVAEEVNAVRVRVASALATARATAQMIPPDLLDVMTTAADEALDECGPDVVGVQCPACGSLARGEGQLIDEGDAESDYEDGIAVWNWVPDLYIMVENFSCPICHLEISGDQELLAAKIPLKVHTDRASPMDVFDQGWDPDYYR